MQLPHNGALLSLPYLDWKVKSHKSQLLTGDDSAETTCVWSTDQCQLGDIQLYQQLATTSMVPLISLTACFWTAPAQKASGDITSAELCHLIQKDTLGSSKLSFIIFSWYRHCSFLKIYVLGFFARKRMGIWVLLDRSRMVLNPVPACGCLATVRPHLIFHWCNLAHLASKPFSFKRTEKATCLLYRLWLGRKGDDLRDTHTHTTTSDLHQELTAPHQQQSTCTFP